MICRIFLKLCKMYLMYTCTHRSESRHTYIFKKGYITIFVHLYVDCFLYKCDLCESTVILEISNIHHQF
uniref:Uncharacterized protein n=1 Tax=Anguilla anguilla TaxID=7936 RepID=A0A0E9X4H2_ANGAN